MISPTSVNYGQLEKKLILTLASAEPLNAVKVKARLAAAGDVYSIQAIYYIFRKLRRLGVVFKNHDKFSLSMSWALDLLDLANQIEKKLLNSIPETQIIPEDGKMLSWTFSSLLALDDFWVHLMLLIFERSPEQRMFNFCQHPWFYFAQRNKIEKFYRVLQRRRRRVHVIIGGTTPLDRKFSSSVSKELYRCHHYSGASLGGSKYKHVMVIGNCIITVRLPKGTGDAIDEAFSQAGSSDLSSLLGLQKVLFASTKARISIVTSPDQAAALRRRFEMLFELK